MNQHTASSNTNSNRLVIDVTPLARASTRERSICHPSRCTVTLQPVGSPDPNKPDFVITEEFRCVECNGRTWACPSRSSDNAGWYVSPYCHVCVDGSADGASGRATLDRIIRNREQRYTNAGLTKYDLSSSERFKLDGRLTGLRLEPSGAWCVYMCGLAGTGKTTQQLLAVQHYVGLGWSCRYVVESALFASLRPNGGQSLQALQALDLLAIDEFGSDVRTDWEAATLRTIINGRYRERRPTILASNHSLRTIATIEGLGEVVATRIFEGIGGRAGVKDKDGRYLEYRHSFRTGLDMRLPSGAIGERSSR
jgi:hypothetical protein